MRAPPVGDYSKSREPVTESSRPPTCVVPLEREREREEKSPSLEKEMIVIFFGPESYTITMIIFFFYFLGKTKKLATLQVDSLTAAARIFLNPFLSSVSACPTLSACLSRWDLFKHVFLLPYAERHCGNMAKNGRVAYHHQLIIHMLNDSCGFKWS